MIKFILVFLLFLVNFTTVAMAQNKVVVVPTGDDSMMPIVMPEEEVTVDPEEAEFLDQAIGKPIVWSKGWDTSIGNRPKIDPTVKIQLRGREPVFGYPGIIFTANEIRHWGLQTAFSTGARIYAKGVLLVDKGASVVGGPFEWSLNNQGFMSFHNILRYDHPVAWIAAWTDPRPGEKVWFFIMSDDERFSSNPISLIW
jgi:hypothetical protein